MDRANAPKSAESFALVARFLHCCIRMGVVNPVVDAVS